MTDYSYRKKEIGMIENDTKVESNEAFNQVKLNISINKPKLIPLYFPPIPLCTDNGVMVAWTGIKFSIK